MQNWSCMHLCGHSSVKFLWSCDARAQDSFPLFVVNPMFPKYVLLSICAFIRVHFECPGKFSQHSPFRCIHIFFQKLVIFSKKSWKHLFSKACWFFSSTTYFSFFLFPFFSLLALFFFFIFIMIFVCFIFWTMFLNEELYTVPEFQINIINNNDISTNATIHTKMYALYKRQSKQQKQTLVSQVKKNNIT